MTWFVGCILVCEMVPGGACAGRGLGGGRALCGAALLRGTRRMRAPCGAALRVGFNRIVRYFNIVWYLIIGPNAAQY